MRLLGAELTRWRHRKGLWATVLVTLAIAAVVCGTLVTASITNQAVDELGLKVGDEAYAVIKASDVMVGKD